MTILSGYALNSAGGIRAFDESAPLQSGEEAYPDYEAASAAIPASITAVVKAETSYRAALSAGCQIVSSGTAALSGTYALDDRSQQRITSEQVYIATTGKFTNGQASRAWPDASGALHTFPTTAAFTAFAEAVAGYVDALGEAYATAAAGGSWTAPTTPVTIA